MVILIYWRGLIVFFVFILRNDGGGCRSLVVFCKGSSYWVDVCGFGVYVSFFKVGEKKDLRCFNCVECEWYSFLDMVGYVGTLFRYFIG